MADGGTICDLVAWPKHTPMACRGLRPMDFRGPVGPGPGVPSDPSPIWFRTALEAH